MHRDALILGITGSVGQAIGRALAAHGWKLRALHRDPARASERLQGLGPIAWIHGDAMNVDDVAAAARGVAVIVHAVNPPGYRNWRGLAIPMLANTIAAARSSGARILFPGNVYNYGPDAWPVITERSPQQPTTRKGRIRVEMETMLAEGADRGARAIVLRAGDFFGANGASSWFENALVRPGKPVKAVTYPGRHDAGHAWAYLPDLAETVARLADREAELAAFETFNFGGHYMKRGVEMAHAIRRVAGVPNAPIRRLPWMAVRLMGLFKETYRELMEMRYLWNVTLQLDNRKLLAFLGEEPRTPLDTAVHDTLAALDCLPQDLPAALQPEAAMCDYTQSHSSCDGYSSRPGSAGDLRYGGCTLANQRR